jgi:PAS domain S-box-containing protein
MSDSRNARQRRRLPPWMKPWVMAAGVGLAAAIGVLNFAAAWFGDRLPWLAATDLVADVAVLAAGITGVVILAMSAEARSLRMQAALDAAHARLRAILESAMDAIIAVDEKANIVVFNRAAEQAFRCPRREAYGAPLERFVPERYRAALRAQIAEIGRAGATSRPADHPHSLWGLRADGEEFPIEVSISEAIVAGRRYYTAILRDATRRKQYEDTLKTQQEEMRELSARVLEAREEEKTLIARELHDELGQLLTALKMDLSWMRERLPADNAELAGKARQMNAMLDQTVASVRRISADLRPLMLDDLGLTDAAQWLVEDFGRRAGIECRLDLNADAGLDALERPAATAVYRALQESLTNIARHSGAKSARVALGLRDGALELEIEDDGRGISREEIAKSRSLGLKGMRERIVYLGGSLEVEGAPGRGTRVRVRLPVGSAARAAP